MHIIAFIFQLRKKQEHFASIVTIYDNVTESGRKNSENISNGNIHQDHIALIGQITGRWNIRSYLYC